MPTSAIISVKCIFFRAFQYFTFMKKYGDFPIVDKILSDDYVELAEANQRRPQNEVARFILTDLDKATEMMKETAPESNRLTKYVALLLKSRVALYEGTWLKYHAGTDRVRADQAGRVPMPVI